MRKRLWDKGEALNEQMHNFTVGNDPALDLRLVEWDALASAAHARMLARIGVLTTKESRALVKALEAVTDLNQQGKFDIPPELEDCHTAIETFLTEEVGEAGLKIHTGRSRNDQVLVAMRLYIRHNILVILDQAIQCCTATLERAEPLLASPMPGYTHFQPAMPTSVGIWLHGFAESLLDQIREGMELVERLNANPLGVASGFGVPLPLDREMTAELLGFSRVQRNPINVINSRGFYELKFIRWCVDIASVLEKIACDVVLFTSSEYGFFSLPNEFTTGSSIMPQKRNPDVMELMRARTGKVRSAEQELTWIIAKLSSGYHRDHQYSKEPVLKAVEHIQEMLPMCSAVISKIGINEERLKEAMIPELYATYETYRMVKQGTSFREAYKHVAGQIADGGIDRVELAKDFSYIEEVARAELASCASELGALHGQVGALTARLKEIPAQVFAVD